MKKTYIITLFKDMEFPENISDKEKMEIVLRTIHDNISIEDYDGMTISESVVDVK